MLLNIFEKLHLPMVATSVFILVSKCTKLKSLLRLEFKIIWVAIAGPMIGGGNFPKINMVGLSTIIAATVLEVLQTQKPP